MCLTGSLNPAERMPTPVCRVRGARCLVPSAVFGSLSGFRVYRVLGFGVYGAQALATEQPGMLCSVWAADLGAPNSQ